MPAWANVIDNCPSYGRASVIGYVWTDYGEGGQASIAGIESQINAWYSYYPGEIAGIFFDGVSDAVPGTSTSNESFYQTLASYVHTHEGAGAQVVFNFGANPGSDWMLKSHEASNNANLVVTFEGSYNTAGEDPYTSWTQAAWEEAYPADDFAALVYNAPNEATPQPCVLVQLAGQAEHRLHLRRHLVRRAGALLLRLSDGLGKRRVLSPVGPRPTGPSLKGPRASRFPPARPSPKLRPREPCRALSAPVPATPAALGHAADEKADEPQQQSDDQDVPENVHREAQASEYGQDEHECH